ncbi:MAG: type II toxin-antitoxin system HipA family toxin [Opitutaceae bacterium]|nr:type II toxin-antitoxin system HipA family toxin [Opitutaceae bacterium]
MVMIARVRLWGRDIGAVSLDDGGEVAAFQYTPDFARSGIQVSPIVMPLGPQVWQFPALPRRTFHGLPGLLADSLPDKFGNALIDAWLARQGRTPAEFSAVDRLCYTGTRGMGALEFAPTLGPRPQKPSKIDLDALVSLASEVLASRDALSGNFQPKSREKALNDILRVGTSAGGARAKAVIAWNPKTEEVRSGQVRAGEDFEYWLLKFDGVKGNKDKELDDPKGFGAIEYAYHLMAKAAGITMSECRLLEENGRRHFMTKRFDRLPDGEKLHMQSLGALAHYDFNAAGAHSYEQALLVMRQLHLPPDQVEQQFRRMVFNVVARDQDDHVKNIAFLMDRAGTWSLSPAFDVCYSYNPSGEWTATHQMTINGKRDKFTRDDFAACAEVGFLKKSRINAITDEVIAAVTRWPEFAAAAKVADETTSAIGRAHRLEISAA